ncbi:MAG: hypothetical protein JRH16_03635 [Deltaproteobacteria bacterium]|nr:hypothetical protein [Deltaproteobacteria bacterium]MBW2360259.1 hypothetical protein [Deltaproteobacteria bacterium]
MTPRPPPALLLCAAVAWLGCAPDPNGPGPTSERFWEALGTADYSAAQALTDSASLAAVRDLAAAHPFAAVELGEALDNESLAQVPTRMRPKPSGGPDFSFHTHLVRGKDGWRVDLRQTRRDLTRELLASSFESVQEALRESGEAFIEEFEERAIEVSEALRETLEELERSLSEPEDPKPRGP